MAGGDMCIVFFQVASGSEIVSETVAAAQSRIGGTAVATDQSRIGGADVATDQSRIGGTDKQVQQDLVTVYTSDPNTRHSNYGNI